MRPPARENASVAAGPGPTPMVRRLRLLTVKAGNEKLGLTIFVATAAVLAAVVGLAYDSTWALLAVVMVIHLSATALVVGAALATAADGQQADPPDRRPCTQPRRSRRGDRRTPPPPRQAATRGARPLVSAFKDASPVLDAAAGDNGRCCGHAGACGEPSSRACGLRRSIVSERPRPARTGAHATATAAAPHRREVQAARSWISTTTPSPTTFDSSSRRLRRSDFSSKTSVPVPRITGKTIAEIRRDPAAAKQRLMRASDELARSLEELRELARGIHSAALAHGLAAALESTAAR